MDHPQDNPPDAWRDPGDRTPRYDSHGVPLDGHGLPVPLSEGAELLPEADRYVLAGRAALTEHLRPMDRLVFAALAACAIGAVRTPYALQGQQILAELAGVGVSTVARSLVALERSGAIGPAEHVPHVMGPRGLRPLWALWPDRGVPR